MLRNCFKKCLLTSILGKDMEVTIIVFFEMLKHRASHCRGWITYQVDLSLETHDVRHSVTKVEVQMSTWTHLIDHNIINTAMSVVAWCRELDVLRALHCSYQGSIHRTTFWAISPFQQDQYSDWCGKFFLCNMVVHINLLNPLLGKSVKSLVETTK